MNISDEMDSSESSLIFDSSASERSYPDSSSSLETSPEPESKNGTSVIIPDFFASIMSKEIVLNPLYQKVKTEAEAWIAKYVLCSAIQI